MGLEAGGLLRGNPAFRLLWLSRTVSFLGDALSLVALLLFVAEGSGQALAVAALLLVGDFVPSLLGPVTGAVGDRFDRRRVLVAGELVQAGAVLLIALTLPPLPVLLLLVGVRAVVGQVVAPASRAAVPALVPDRALEAANSALGFGANGMDAFGPLVAAALLPLVGIRGVLVVDAATFLVSAVLLARLPALRVAAGHPRQALLREARAGLRYLWRVPLVRVVGLGFVAVVACTGVDDVALVFLARDSLQAGDSAVAVLYSAVGVGLLAGYAGLARWAGRAPATVVVLVGFAVSSAGNLLTGLAWAVAAACALQLVRGLGISAIDVGVATVLQRSVAPEMLGRVFGNVYGAVGVAAAVSYLLGSLLLELTGPRATFVVAGAGGLLATLVTALALARARPAQVQ